MNTHWGNITRILSQPSSQSWLFWGEKALGASSKQLSEQAIFAEKLVAWLFCDNTKNIKNPVPTEPCGACQPCRWLTADTHPDYLKLTLAATETSINVETVRQIKAFSEQKRHHGMYRIILISPAEAMNISAANALLKILEEPFENTLFFLVSSHISWLLPTIRSRCQKLYFPTNTTVSDIYIPAKAALFSLMDNVMSSAKKNPIETVEKIKAIEKTNNIVFEEIIDLLLLYFHQWTTLKKNKIGYLFYDKLLEIKKRLKIGININQTIWLEDLFV